LFLITKKVTPAGGLIKFWPEITLRAVARAIVLVEFEVLPNF